MLKTSITLILYLKVKPNYTCHFLLIWIVVYVLFEPYEVYNRFPTSLVVYGHTTLKIPVLVRSLKSSSVGRG